jgi:hypothetical protein
MASQIDNNFRSFSFASAISGNILVQADSTANAAVAAVSPGYTIGVVSGGGITAGLVVKADGNGKLVASTLTAGVVTVGIALANGEDGDVIEYAPKFNL